MDVQKVCLDRVPTTPEITLSGGCRVRRQKGRISVHITPAFTESTSPVSPSRCQHSASLNRPNLPFAVRADCAPGAGLQCVRRRRGFEDGDEGLRHGRGGDHPDPDQPLQRAATGDRQVLHRGIRPGTSSRSQDPCSSVRLALARKQSAIDGKRYVF